MQTGRAAFVNGRSWVERYAGWCPRAGAFRNDLDTGSILQDTQKSRAALPRRVLAPALVFLLPLLPALMFTGYTLVIPVLLPSTEVQMAVKSLMVGIPAAVVILYGRRTLDAIGATLSGALLYPLFGIYSQALGLLFIPGFMATPAIHWLHWSMVVGAVPFIVLLGAMGFSASKKTNGSLLIAAFLGMMAIAIVWGLG
jgi:hypothetical protein